MNENHPDGRIRDCRIDIKAIKVGNNIFDSPRPTSEESDTEYLTAEESISGSDSNGKRKTAMDNSKNSVKNLDYKTRNKVTPEASSSEYNTAEEVISDSNSTNSASTVLSFRDGSFDDTRNKRVTGRPKKKGFFKGTPNQMINNENPKNDSENNISQIIPTEVLTEESGIEYSTADESMAESNMTEESGEILNLSHVSQNPLKTVNEQLKEKNCDDLMLAGNDHSDMKCYAPTESKVRKAGEKYKLSLTNLNPHLICMLCAGYFVEATTINECLHTFCKSCIVRCLQTSNNCPACSILVHETEPLSKLRLDRTMQDILAVLVPHISQDEERRRKKFYLEYEKKEEQEEKPKTQKSSKKVLADVKFDFRESRNEEDEQINFHLRLKSSEDGSVNSNVQEIVSGRYGRCSTRLQILQLKSLICQLYGIKKSRYNVDIECNGDLLQGNDFLKRVYVVNWKRKPQPLLLHYIISEIDDTDSKKKL